MRNLTEKDIEYLSLAEELSKKSTCLRRRYGAVIVKGGKVISTGYNTVPIGDETCVKIGKCNRDILNVPKGQRYELCKSVHAEQYAMISAGKKDMIGSVIYIYGTDYKTGEMADPTPCLLCSRLLKACSVLEVRAYNEDRTALRVMNVQELKR